MVTNCSQSLSKAPDCRNFTQNAGFARLPQYWRSRCFPGTSLLTLSGQKRYLVDRIVELGSPTVDEAAIIRDRHGSRRFGEAGMHTVEMLEQASIWPRGWAIRFARNGSPAAAAAAAN